MVSWTLNVRGPSYLGLTRSISRLLMPWLLTSPGHQQPPYWLYRICRSFSYLRKCLSTCFKSMWRNGIRCKYMFMFPQKKIARKGIYQYIASMVSVVVVSHGLLQSCIVRVQRQYHVMFVISDFDGDCDGSVFQLELGITTFGTLKQQGIASGWRLDYHDVQSKFLSDVSTQLSIHQLLIQYGGKTRATSKQ